MVTIISVIVLTIVSVALTAWDIKRKDALRASVESEVIDAFESVERITEPSSLFKNIPLDKVALVGVEPLYDFRWHDFLFPFKDMRNLHRGYFIYPREEGFGSEPLCIAVSVDKLEEVVRHLPKELNLIFK